MDFMLWLKKQNLDKSRERRYLRTLELLKSINPEIGNFSDHDVLDAFSKIMSNESWSNATKLEYWKMAKRILLLHGVPSNKLGIRPKIKPRRKGPSDILALSEVKRIISSVTNLKHKAALALLYDTGCRPGELFNISYYDLEFDERGMKVRLTGKTGERVIRVITTLGSNVLVNQYLASISADSDPYPFKMSHNMLIKIIRTAAAKALIRKRITPYTFRHTRATHLAQLLTESQMRVYFGWAPGSDMVGVYVHLSGRDLEGRVFELNNSEIIKRMFGSMAEEPEFIFFVKTLYQAWKARQAKGLAEEFDGVL